MLFALLFALYHLTCFGFGDFVLFGEALGSLEENYDVRACFLVYEACLDGLHVNPSTKHLAHLVAHAHIPLPVAMHLVCADQVIPQLLEDLSGMAVYGKRYV